MNNLLLFIPFVSSMVLWTLIHEYSHLFVAHFFSGGTKDVKMALFPRKIKGERRWADISWNWINPPSSKSIFCVYLAPKIMDLFGIALFWGFLYLEFPFSILWIGIFWFSQVQFILGLVSRSSKSDLRMIVKHTEKKNFKKVRLILLISFLLVNAFSIAVFLFSHYL